MMHPLAKLAAKLYPRWWRERYGEEFAALLEDARPGLRGAFDIARTGVAFRAQTWSPRQALFRLTLLGLAAGIVVAFSLPVRFTSNSALSIHTTDSPNQIPQRISTLSAQVLGNERIQSIADKVHSRRNGGDLTVETIRKNVRITPLRAIVGGADSRALLVQFDHPDRFIAQIVVSELNKAYINASYEGRVPGGPGLDLELLDAATMPVSPNTSRTRVVAAGAGVGLFAGSMLAWALRKPRENAIRSRARRVLTAIATPRRAMILCSALGLLFGTAMVVGRDPRYLSTATISLPSSAPHTLADAIDELEIHSRASLAALMRNLDLYPSERQRYPLETVVDGMRRDVEIRPLPDGRSLVIDFSYSDAELARRTVGEITAQVLASNLRRHPAGDAPALEVRIPATAPVRSDRPWWQIEVFGTAMGAAVGSMAALLVSRKSKAA